MSAVKGINFFTLTNETLKEVHVPTLEPSKNNQGYSSSTPKLHGKDIIIQSPILSAKGFGVSGPNPQKNIKGYSMTGQLQDPRKPPLGADGKPNLAAYNTRKKILQYFEDAITNGDNLTTEHKFFQFLFRTYTWFQDVVKERCKEFLNDGEVPSQKELDEKAIHPVKVGTQAATFAKALQYGPNFAPEIREKFVEEEDATGAKVKTKTGYYCSARKPDGSPVDIEDLIGRHFTFQMVFKMSQVWHLSSTDKCGIKFECMFIQVIEFFDADVKVEIDQNMYGEIPDSALIAATEAAEAEYALHNYEELPQEAQEEETKKRDREEEEEEEEEAPKKTPAKKGKTSKK